MVTRARFTADLVSTVNANTSSPANAIFISSGGDVTIANSITVGGNIPGFVQNSYVHATFAQNTSTTNLFDDRLQVANAAAAYVTKAVHLTSNNALINLINDRLQVANADTTYVTKAVALSSNTALVGLINDRLQVANLTSELSTYWPSANAIAYINANASASDMTVNTSIFVASGGETSFAIPVTSNTNLVEVVLNGYELTRSIDWTANSTHIKGIEALAAGDIVQVHEYKLHPANTLNRSAGGGGGGGGGYQGTVAGYTMGGTPPLYNNIEKFPFSISSGTASDVGDLTGAADVLASAKSSTNGYATGGSGPASIQNVIQKFPFSSDTNASDVGDLTTVTREHTGMSSTENGYTAGGRCIWAPTYTIVAKIEKFPFASDTNATCIGDTTSSVILSQGHSSTTHGYKTGGCNFPTNTHSLSDIIEKFPFSSDTNASDVGDLTSGQGNGRGLSSPTAGFVAGGTSSVLPSASGTRTQIDSFPFASDANATDVGDLVNDRGQQGDQGSSSTTDGFTAHGGEQFSPYATTYIEKFNFGASVTTTGVGDMGYCARYSTQTQA